METEHMSAPLFDTNHPRKVPFRIPRRRIKKAVVRLGGGVKRRSWGGKRILLGFLKRLKLRLLVKHYRQAIEKLRKVYAQMLTDLVEGTASLEMIRAHTSLDYHFTAPFNPVSSVHNGSLPDYYRTR